MPSKITPGDGIFQFSVLSLFLHANSTAFSTFQWESAGKFSTQYSYLSFNSRHFGNVKYSRFFVGQIIWWGQKGEKIGISLNAMNSGALFLSFVQHSNLPQIAYRISNLPHRNRLMSKIVFLVFISRAPNESMLKMICTNFALKLTKYEWISVGRKANTKECVRVSMVFVYVFLV